MKCTYRSGVAVMPVPASNTEGGIPIADSAYFDDSPNSKLACCADSNYSS